MLCNALENLLTPLLLDLWFGFTVFHSLELFCCSTYSNSPCSSQHPRLLVFAPFHSPFFPFASGGQVIAPSSVTVIKHPGQGHLKNNVLCLFILGYKFQDIRHHFRVLEEDNVKQIDTSVVKRRGAMNAFRISSVQPVLSFCI